MQTKAVCKREVKRDNRGLFAFFEAKGLGEISEKPGEAGTVEIKSQPCCLGGNTLAAKCFFLKRTLASLCMKWFARQNRNDFHSKPFPWYTVGVSEKKTKKENRKGNTLARTSQKFGSPVKLARLRRTDRAWVHERTRNRFLQSDQVYLM